MPKLIIPKRFRRAAIALLAAIFTAFAGVATNRVEGAWWSQATFFSLSVFALTAAAILAGTPSRSDPSPRRMRKARKKVLTKMLPSIYNHQASTWLNEDLVSEFPIPSTYSAMVGTIRKGQRSEE